MTEDRAKAFLHMIRRSQRGRLKVYLGYGPGVGKTYQMLQEAHRLKKDGIDVVVGVVETHGRAETASLVAGLEVVPRRQVEYHGIQLDEMDVDQVLQRKPEVVLVDELAHTNIPGSRNAKRYEDAQELLAAGIHVIATLNVQHLESLYNTVEKLVGVKVRERIPDAILADADQVVNVDLTPEDLQRRLHEGKVYPKERIAPALENFFTPANLEHLRELTMREIASQIDFKRREGWEQGDKIAPDQIMVCLASKGPNSARLLRFASRLAGRLNRNWYAVYIQTPSEDPTRIDATTQRLLADTLTLANQLGATVFTFKGQNVVDAILTFAAEYRVGHIVIGRPRPIPEWKRRVIGIRSVAEELVIRAEGFTVVVVDAATDEARTNTSIEDTTSEEVLKGKQPEAAQASNLHLSELLLPRRLLMIDTSITRDDLLSRMVNTALSGFVGLEPEEVLHLIRQREQQGSTFLNEGIAVPHAKLPGLAVPVAALAVLRGGILDVPTEKPTEVVFLLLEPATPEGGPHLPVLTTAVRTFQNASLRRALVDAASPEAMLDIIRQAEGG